MEYIYNRGNEGSKMVGYEKGVFSTVYFEVQEIIEALDHDEESVEAAITELYSDSHIEFKKGRVGLNETGMAFYIDQYFKR